eukprot:1001599-Rhodomonas_salina.1
MFSVFLVPGPGALFIKLDIGADVFCTPRTVQNVSYLPTLALCAARGTDHAYRPLMLPLFSASGRFSPSGRNGESGARSASKGKLSGSRLCIENDRGHVAAANM